MTTTTKSGKEREGEAESRREGVSAKHHTSYVMSDPILILYLYKRIDRFMSRVTSAERTPAFDSGIRSAIWQRGETRLDAKLSVFSFRSIERDLRRSANSLDIGLQNSRLILATRKASDGNLPLTRARVSGRRSNGDWFEFYGQPGIEDVEARGEWQFKLQHLSVHNLCPCFLGNVRHNRVYVRVRTRPAENRRPHRARRGGEGRRNLNYPE